MSRPGDDLFEKYFTPILLIALAALIIAAIGCKKPEQTTRLLKFTMYSQHPKFTFKYVDVDQVWYTDTLYTNSHTQSVAIHEASMTNLFTISGVDVYPSDSVFIRCEVDGKSVQRGMKVLNNAAAASVQPSEAK